MKKLVLILINLTLVGLLILSGFYLIHVMQNRQISQMIKEKNSQLLVKGKQDIKEGNIGHTHVTVYYPKDEKGNRIVAVEEAIDRDIQKNLGSKSPKGEIQHLLFVSTTDTPTKQSAVRKTEIVSQAYKVGTFKITEEAALNKHTILLTTDNQPFTLASFFTNQELAKSIISNKIKAELEAKQVPANEIEEKLQHFQNTNLQDIDFTYEGGQIVLNLSDKNLGLDQVTTEIAAYFDCINEVYLVDADKPAYEAFQAEKAKKARENMIALTFDDGPNPKTTPIILDILKKYNAKATFFILGQNIAGNEDIIKRMVAEGHEVANHSWSHPNFVTLSADRVKQEVEQTQSALEKITGKRPTLIRPPYGAVNQAVMSAMNMPAMYWSVDSLDWKSRNPQAVLSVVQANARPGSIVLMHDIHQSTADAVESVIKYLQGKGLTMVTLPDLLGQNLDPHLVYYDRDSARPAS